MAAERRATDVRPATIGIIPARGGSKRIPRKNVREFHGRPLIAHSITAMVDSGIFDRIVVSTDDDEIADVAIAAGAEAPFRRPDELSDDHTGTGAVIRHALDMLIDASADGSTVDETAVCLMYPAAVFVTPDDLSAALETLIENTVDYVFSASRFSAPIERALAIGDDGLASMLEPEHLLTRSQDLDDRFHDVGQFYWGRCSAWRAATPVMTGRSMVHQIPAWRVQDIDTADDWTRAEILFELLARLDE